MDTTNPFIVDIEDKGTIDIDSLMNETIKDPIHWGRCRCYWYKNHIPRITIGPQCKFFIS